MLQVGTHQGLEEGLNTYSRPSPQKTSSSNIKKLSSSNLKELVHRFVAGGAKAGVTHVFSMVGPWYSAEQDQSNAMHTWQCLALRPNNPGERAEVLLDSSPLKGLGLLVAAV